MVEYMGKIEDGVSKIVEVICKRQTVVTDTVKMSSIIRRTVKEEVYVELVCTNS